MHVAVFWQPYVVVLKQFSCACQYLLVVGVHLEEVEGVDTLAVVVALVDDAIEVEAGHLIVVVLPHLFCESQ